VCDFSDTNHLLLAFRVAVFLVVGVFVGCGGSDRATVSGTLLHQDGTPLVGARVIAQTNGKGYFELGGAKEGDGIPPGDYYVTIVEDFGDENNPRPASISNKYRNPNTSGLGLSVKAGEEAVLDAKLDGR